MPLVFSFYSGKKALTKEKHKFLLIAKEDNFVPQSHMIMTEKLQENISLLVQYSNFQNDNYILCFSAIEHFK